MSGSHSRLVSGLIAAGIVVSSGENAPLATLVTSRQFIHMGHNMSLQDVLFDNQKASYIHIYVIFNELVTRFRHVLT